MSALPKKIYLNYVDENDEVKTWSEEPMSFQMAITPKARASIATKAKVPASRIAFIYLSGAAHPMTTRLPKLLISAPHFRAKNTED